MRILGLDYGARRIGVALSDPTGTMGQPLTVIDKRDKEAALREITKLVNDNNVEEVVVGLPISMSGEIGAQAQEVLEFVDKLKEQLSVPVTTWDERLTTSYADRTLIESDMKRDRRKQVIDKVAAAIILQGYLDHKRQENQAI